jgi:hypothetical protein
MARKRSARQQEEMRAKANRLAFGQSRSSRQRQAAERAKAENILDRHRIEKGDDP